MKNKVFIAAIFTLFFLTGCNEPINYLYQDKVQKVDCPGLDKALMHEALYSFQEDIGAFYNKFTDYAVGSTRYYMEGYRQYVYFGFSGIAAYNDIVSEHSLEVLEQLRNESDLWINEEGTLKLNYQSEYVSCLLKSIQNEELRQKFQSMLEVDYFSPELIADTMRVNIIEVVQDPYLAMYMALDSYYVYLINRDLSFKKKEYESD